MTNFADPTFSHHLAIALVWSKLALSLATTPVLPYDPQDYAAALSRIYQNLEKQYGDTLTAQNIDLGMYALALVILSGFHICRNDLTR